MLKRKRSKRKLKLPSRQRMQTSLLSMKKILTLPSTLKTESNGFKHNVTLARTPILISLKELTEMMNSLQHTTNNARKRVNSLKIKRWPSLEELLPFVLKAKV
jgi:hypothetical protein